MSLFFIIFAIVNVAACIVAWFLESKKGIYYIKYVKDNMNKWKTVMVPFYVAKAIFLMFPLFVDIAVTMGLIAIFNFGGWYGGVLGLFASNLISLLIIRTLVM